MDNKNCEGCLYYRNGCKLPKGLDCPEKGGKEMIQKLEHCVRGTDYGCGGATFSEVIDKVNEVIDYINSLPEEKPSEDLEKEIDDYLEPIKAWQIQEAPFTNLENCARHFYELGLNARKEEQK